MAAHFIVYAARSSAKHFFEGLSDPSFFANINKILDDGYYERYEDPRGRVFAFENLKDFLASSNGLGVDDWVAFMKALKAQDEGTEAKALFWRMVGIDPGLDPLVGQMLTLESPQFAQAGDNQHTLKDGGDNVTTRANDTAKGNSAAYLVARLKKAGRDDLLIDIGPGKRFKSARAAAIEAGIIIPFPSLQLKDPAPTAKKLFDKQGREWCLQLLEELSELALKD